MLTVTLLAGSDTGIYSSIPEACEAAIKRVSTQSSIAENAAIYNKYYKVYGDVYQSLKQQFKAVAEIMK